jgi:hypothetical protein
MRKTTIATLMGVVFFCGVGLSSALANESEEVIQIYVDNVAVQKITVSRVDKPILSTCVAQTGGTLTKMGDVNLESRTPSLIGFIATYNRHTRVTGAGGQCRQNSLVYLSEDKWNKTYNENLAAAAIEKKALEILKESGE